MTVTEHSGRTLQLGHDFLGRLVSVTLPDGSSVQYQFQDRPIDPDNDTAPNAAFTPLKQIVHPDTSTTAYRIEP
jgi:YD repeat-containing protein